MLSQGGQGCQNEIKLLVVFFRNETYWKDIQVEMYKLFMPIALDIDDWSWCSDSTLWVGTQHAAGYYQYIWSEVSTQEIKMCNSVTVL